MRDPRKNSAFDSGLRGREKPKVADAHGKTLGQEAEGNHGGESKQGANTIVGNPDGVNLNDSAYSSGMRGMEKAKQKKAAEEGSPAGSATWGQEREGKLGGESKQGPDTLVGHPDGRKSWSSDDRGPKKGVNDSHIQSTASAAHDFGAGGSNTNLERAATSKAPMGDGGILGDEDDTHINLRIPKASLKKKNPGLQTN